MPHRMDSRQRSVGQLIFPLSFFVALCCATVLCARCVGGNLCASVVLLPFPLPVVIDESTWLRSELASCGSSFYCEFCR